MAVKRVELAGIGPVTLVKSARNKGLRLTVTSKGVRVSLPRWTSYTAATAFAQAHSTWIASQLAKQASTLLEAGQRVGKLHYVRFEQILNNRPATSRVSGTEIVVGVRPGEASTDAVVQARATAAALRALKREAEQLLPPRLAHMAETYGVKYKSITVRELKRRWGSCDSHGNLTFNLYLMELPWEYIDYVLKHELAHTMQMNHGPAFWQVLTEMEPRARDLARQLRRRQPLMGTEQ